MSSIVKNSSALSESLFAFNNQVVGMKNVVQKAKVAEIAKIVRRIKLIAKKKGDEAQIEKNKRKCEHLKEEISIIKKLKVIEVAIFSLENDGLNFDQYIKKTKSKLDTAAVSLARLALSKLVVNELAKIKANPKITSVSGGWKHILIQYKSRLEKRKSWKEKTKLLKEIESKLAPDEEAGEPVAQNNEENKEIKPSVKEPSLPKVEKKVESAKTDNKVLSNMEDGDDEDNDDALSMDSAQYDHFEQAEDESENESETDEQEDKPKVKKVAKEVEEDEIDEESDQEYEDEDEEKSDDISEPDVNLDDMFVYSKSNLEDKSRDLNKRDPKDAKLVITEKKPAHMEIRQINLDEIDGLDELPIGNNTEADTSESVPETMKIENDPFFLDKDGKEIKGADVSMSHHYNSNYHDRRDEWPRYQSRYESNYEDKSNFNNRKSMFKSSSFKSSLSDQNNGGGFRSNYSSNRPFRGRGGAGGHYGDRQNFNNDNNSWQQRDTRRPPYQNNYNSSQATTSRFQGRPSAAQQPNKPSPTDNPATLHPSWQAKKQMEDKLKALKFNGKKITFDD